MGERPHPRGRLCFQVKSLVCVPTFNLSNNSEQTTISLHSRWKWMVLSLDSQAELLMIIEMSILEELVPRRFILAT